MKKYTPHTPFLIPHFSFLISLLAFVGTTLKATAQDKAYTILSECDTTVKAQIEGFSLGSRDVRLYIYEYPSVNADGQPATVSGIIMAPSDIVDGSVPCDGVIMMNHYTIGSPSQAPSQGGLDIPSGLLANPLKPNYIMVMSDYIGYGSSINHPIAYLCGDTNARNCLDGLLAAQQLLTDAEIPQGKYLFNMGFSQGGTESMYAAKLTDMEDKYKGIRFDKTFAGGGPLDFERIYTDYVDKDVCDDVTDVVLMITSVNENCHLGIDYHDLFKEPTASHAKELFDTKDKGVASRSGIMDLDSLSQVLQPAYMDKNSEQAQALRAKLKEISLAEGWEPDVTKNYYIEHSRHDNYVPIQCVRGILPWMTKKGFTKSIVPGKTSLQTNMVVFKLKHQQSAIVWGIQTMVAAQVWPVIYYEGEQNRYYHEFVSTLNIKKVIQYLEGIGIDLRKIIKNKGLSRSFEQDIREELENGTLQPDDNLSRLYVPRRDFFDVLNSLSETFAKVDLTITDVLEMIDDSGITILDILEVYMYLTSSDDGSRLAEAEDTEDVEAAIYLTKMYEQTLAKWLIEAGVNTGFKNWGW